MDRKSVEAVVLSLKQHHVRYLIVGGLAVVAHGHMRFTADIDLILAVDEDNLRRAVSALKSLEYRPRAPVPLDDFVDPKKRRQWADDKQMTVFSLSSPRHPTTEIDLFLESPIDFEKAYQNAMQEEIAPGIPAVFCGFEDLIALKSKANRPNDRDDIAMLRQLRGGGQS